MQEILQNNLALTHEELQLLNNNSGLIYVAKRRFQQRDGFDYVRKTLVDSNGLVRAMRACILVFRSELDRKLQNWLQLRVKGRHTKFMLKELTSYACSASEMLRHFDDLSFRITRQIGHEQKVFQALVERYRLDQLVQELHQRLAELHYQIRDLHGQIQSRQLRWLNFLVIFLALYQAWKLLQELVQLMRS